ncbi:DUF397 domain-containing protein [Streptomyces sp. HNM0645]|uniref:DUF397 domain-containing protein n=1 Tax=Streptomyces sp. HNM0645 TaxID=2782343 RepID=UPI0024B6374B|nr:DUF397 domain-containing protein [Streptomyces sp. HNM0645]MDI9883889.1 DUF397 domain-containing protein [Streptomyces sp. HNM0645]
MTDSLRWFKSSYSDSGGGECVEVAFDWRKSSYSSDCTGACVEVAACPHAVHVRDSKDPEGPVFTVAPGAWASFVGHAAGA